MWAEWWQKNGEDGKPKRSCRFQFELKCNLKAVTHLIQLSKNVKCGLALLTTKFTVKVGVMHAFKLGFLPTTEGKKK